MKLSQILNRNISAGIAESWSGSQDVEVINQIHEEWASELKKVKKLFELGLRAIILVNPKSKLGKEIAKWQRDYSINLTVKPKQKRMQSKGHSKSKSHSERD